jgi:hypothetical protein
VFTAPDGTQWHAGVRWFYEGEYHLKPPKNRKHGSYYHVFVLAADVKTRRVYEMRKGDMVRVKLPELARRFANSHYTERERFDGKGRLEGAHFHPPAEPKD